jgi:tetraacyldisaccharide 4'-kinase
MSGALTRLWYGNARTAALLQPLASLYGAAVRLRRAAYAHGLLQQSALGCPVVVVGNLVVGGTGKTPLVAWLARELKARGFSVGIMSRGYGRTASDARLVAHDASWGEVGDEPLLLARATGCLTAVGADRLASGRMLRAGGANVIVSDDGLQHLRLSRDCQIVVVDGERGFGNGRLLPAGPLREPIARLGGADAVVINAASPSVGLVERCRRLNATVVQMQLVPGAVTAVIGHERRSLESFRGTPVHAVAGIGNPARFFGELRLAGLTVIEHAFADHHAFVASDLDFGDDLAVLMTEKDAVKCTSFAGRPLWYVPVTVELSLPDAQELMARVARRLEIYRR